MHVEVILHMYICITQHLYYASKKVGSLQLEEHFFLSQLLLSVTVFFLQRYENLILENMHSFIITSMDHMPIRMISTNTVAIRLRIP